MDTVDRHRAANARTPRPGAFGLARRDAALPAAVARLSQDPRSRAIRKILIRRLPYALVTLFILGVLVFAGGQLLPGDVGRAILGPLADQRAVENLNHQLGADRPLIVQYWDWISHFAVGDMGQSFTYRAPVAPFVGAALLNSLKLGAVAFAIVVPLGIVGGIVAALHRDRLLDHTIVLVGLSATVLPEFVSGIVLILLFGITIRLFPISATPPAGSGALMQLYYLVLPAIPLVFVVFGYIARMARAGTVAAIDSDYTRTAVLKGLPWRIVVTRHVLRNALLPTITVVASQTGYLVGGLVVIETLFHYQGIGSLIYTAARGHDFPMLEAGIMTVGLIYVVSTLAADLAASALNPRIRYGAGP